jgi:hypothetical protein
MMPVVIAQIPAKISSVYARTTKNWPLTPEREHDHHDPADQSKPPEAVDRPLGERLHHPHHPDEQEDEAEDVGEAGEGAGGVDQRHDPGCREEHAVSALPGVGCITNEIKVITAG